MKYKVGNVIKSKYADLYRKVVGMVEDKQQYKQQYYLITLNSSYSSDATPVILYSLWVDSAYIQNFQTSLYEALDV